MGKRTYGVLGSTSTVSSGDRGAGNGAPTNAFIVNASPCNLQYLYVYITTALDPTTEDAWLQIFDANSDVPSQGIASFLSGRAPKYVDKISSRMFNWEPPQDAFVSIPAKIGNGSCVASDMCEGYVSMFLGAPFEVGLVVGISSTEATYTAGTACAYIMARINDLNCVPYYGDSGGTVLPPQLRPPKGRR